MWNLNSALDFIRPVQSEAFERGYNLSLGGSVLNKGESQKDLDIVCVPRNGEDCDWFTHLKFIYWLQKKFAHPHARFQLCGWNKTTNKLTVWDGYGRVVDWFIVFNAALKPE